MANCPTPRYFPVRNINTWIELTYNQNQADVLKYAKGMLDNGFPPGALMIDDTCQEDYGLWKFHPGRFPDPADMVDKVAIWVGAHYLGFSFQVCRIAFLMQFSSKYQIWN